jgi:hypothetical protein
MTLRGGRLVVPEIAGTDHIENGICGPLTGLVRCRAGRTPPAAIRRPAALVCRVPGRRRQRTTADRVLLSGPVRRGSAYPVAWT